MKIEIERASLLPALAVVSGVVDRRHTLPILGNILLECVDGKVTVSATDLELQVVTRCDAVKGDEGRITLPARKMFDICRALPEDARIQLGIKDERATIASASSRFVLSTLPADGFPRLTEGSDGTSFQISQGALRRLVEKAAVSMAVQDVRYYLNGVLFDIAGDRILAVATDGHRLSRIEGQINEVQEHALQMILPAKCVAELKRILEPSEDEVVVRCSDRTMTAVVGDTAVTTKLVDGRYPEFDRVVPKGLEKNVVIDRTALMKALHRTAILSHEKFKGVRLTFVEGRLRLQSENPQREEAQEEIEVTYSGEEVSMAFNVSYLLDALGVVEDDEVEIAFSGPSSGTIWKGRGRTDETLVIMPLQI